MMLFWIFAAFIIGFFVGKKGLLKFILKFNPITYITLILLFFMGYEIGSSKGLIEKIGKIGYLSILLAIASIIGSVLFTTLFDFFFIRKNKE